jgi:hypothetical protein
MVDRNVPVRLARPVHRRVSAAYPAVAERLSVLRTLIERELTVGLSVDIPWRRRLWLYRRGFTSRSSALFDITPQNYREYVSDVQHERANDVTEPWGATVDNKLTFYLLFGSFDEHLPGLYGTLDAGTLRRSSPLMSLPPWRDDDTLDDAAADRNAGTNENTVEQWEAAAWIERYLRERDAVVLKPVYGQGGADVLICRSAAEDDGVVVNGDAVSVTEFAGLIDGLDEYLVWEFVEQADYAAALYPDSVNTLRVLTMWDYERDEPFVVGAVQRIGTDRSAPVDNWSQGGLSAEVTAGNELSRGAQWLPAEGEVRWFETHPDRGGQVAGTPVPDWPAVRDRIAEMAAALPSLPRLGWDVVLTGDGGFVVLEVNAHAATRTLQVHRPLLRDPRVRRFYDHHGCL